MNAPRLGDKSPREERELSWTTIRDMDGMIIARTHSVSFMRRWGWISEIVAAHCECDPDEIGLTDDDDFITANGKPVAYIERPSLPSVELLQAAE